MASPEYRNGADCVVVGAGIIGMLTAWLLRAAGLDVLLVERGEAGRESSWAGGGIISPLYPWRYPDAVNRLARRSQALYPGLVQRILEASGADPEYLASGLLILDTEEEAAATAWAGRYADEFRIIGQKDIAAVELALREGIASRAFWLPRIGQVRNPRFARALRLALAARGAGFLEHCPVDGLRVQGGRVTGVETGRGFIPAGRVVVAGGAWSRGLLAPTGIELPVRPVRGQMILFHGQPGQVRRIVLHRGRYVIPRRDGRILVGSTLEEVGFDKSVTSEAREELRKAAVKLVPLLADLDIEHHWAGLRPGSPDGIPMVGPHPGIEGLHVNTGHYRNGVVLGPASAELLVALMLGEEPRLDPGPYNPAAFERKTGGS